MTKNHISFGKYFLALKQRLNYFLHTFLQCRYQHRQEIFLPSSTATLFGILFASLLPSKYKYKMD